MWTLRIISGDQVGQTYKLKDGKNKIGRGPQCDFQIQSSGVSKEHVEVEVVGEKVIFTDLGSSNGTYHNGVKVKSGVLQAGDKLGLSSIVIDLVFAVKKPKAELPKVMSHVPQGPVQLTPQQQFPADFPLQQNPYPMAQAPVFGYGQGPQQPISAPPPRQLTLSERFDKYMNEVVMHPLYVLAEQVEFKIILICFVSVYVVLVTALSVIPMHVITSDSIQRESIRRASTVARALVLTNEKVLRSGEVSQFSTESALKEEGIDDVYIVGKDGRILAPADRIGTIPKEVEFFKQYSKKTANLDTAVIGTQVGAAMAITGFDPEAQKNVTRAWAVVVYNPGSLTIGDGQVLNLFIQTLAISLFLGYFLFYFLNRLVEYPYYQVNQSLDEALRENRDNISNKIKLNPLQALLANINTALNRMINTKGGEANNVAAAGSKNNEYLNILSLIGFPAMLIDQSGVILKVNNAFEQETNLGPAQVENQKVNMIPDQAMQKNILELMQATSQNPSMIASDKLPLRGYNFKISCQAMTTATGDVDCYFVTISPLEGSEGNAA